MKAGALEDCLRASRRLFLPPLPTNIGSHVYLRITSHPGQMKPGSQNAVRVSIRNDSAELLASIGPNPVRCSYHWLSGLTHEPVQFEGHRTLLTAEIAPGSQHEQAVDVLAPAIEGEYLLRMTLVQEQVFWFDSLTPAVAADVPITVSVSEPNPGTFSLQPIAAFAGLRIVRDGGFSNLAFINDSLPDSLCFVETEAFAKQAEINPNISAVITRPELADAFSERLGLAISDSPRHAFAVLHNRLASNTQFYWTDFPSVIHASARIHPKSCIAEQNVIVGANVIVHANATILERTFIEEGGEIQPGAVVGSIGFQSIRGKDAVIDLAHAGGIRIGARAHILANAVIARGVFRQMTEIGQDARIGNGAFVSHNTSIGPNSFVGHGAVVNGNVSIGSNAWIGPGATIVHGVRIGDGAHVSFGSAVMRDVAPGERVIGSIALPQRKMLRMIATLNR
jgi:UDP-3-O-[3-hydroxymyristoyl] glucosamine N-acyltransferase